jgi:hypothetical protein
MTEQSRAGCRFFQRLPHRFGADRLDQTQDDHLVSQQLQCPVAPPTRRVGASQFDELLLNVSFDLDLVRTRWPRLGIKGRFNPLGHKPLTDAGNGPRACTQGCDDVLVARVVAMHGIRQKQDASVSQLATCGLPDGDQSLQRNPLLDIQCHSVLFHHSAPSLEDDPSNMASSSRRRFTRQL